MPKQSRNKATMESYFGKAAMARQDERYKSVVPISPDQKKSIQDRELKEAADRSRVMANRAKFTGKAEGNYEIEYRRLREQGLSAEKAQKIASTVAASRAATTKSQDITHATFDVNKGGMQKAQAKPGKSNSEVIAAAQTRLASGTRTPDEAKWDRKLIQASRDRMKTAGETESIPTDIANRQSGLVRHKGQFISKPTDEDIGHSRRAEEMRTQLALSQQRIDATPPAPTRAPTFIAPPSMGSESRLEANTTKVAASTASAETVMSGRTTPTIKEHVARIDAHINEAFRPDWDEPQDRERPTGIGDIPPDRLKEEIAYAKQHKRSTVTVKIPSYSEVSIPLEAAQALDAHFDGDSQDMHDRRMARQAARPDIQHLPEVYDRTPDQHKEAAQLEIARAKSPEDLKKLVAQAKSDRVGLSMGYHAPGWPSQHRYQEQQAKEEIIKAGEAALAKIEPKHQLPGVQAKLAEIAQKRTKLENQVQKALANPDRS
jgi:hypothetical protein